MAWGLLCVCVTNLTHQVLEQWLAVSLSKLRKGLFNGGGATDEVACDQVLDGIICLLMRPAAARTVGEGKHIELLELAHA